MLLSKVNYTNTVPSTVVPVSNSNFLKNDDYRANSYLMHQNTVTGANSAALSAYTAAAAAALSASTQHHPHHHLNSSTHSIEVILGAQRILQSEFEKTFQNNGENYKRYNSDGNTSSTEVLKAAKQLNSSYDPGKVITLNHLNS